VSLAIVVITIFIAGTAVGYFIAALLEHFRLAKRDRTEKLIVRSRILAGIKQQHEQDVLQQIFQTVEAIHTDTEKSLRHLVNSIEDLLLAIQEKQGSRRKKSTKTSEGGFYLLKKEDTTRNTA
jgi:uncharacterized membrane-anchored protein YhcB (DUF1043 family)